MKEGRSLNKQNNKIGLVNKLKETKPKTLFEKLG